MSITHAEFLQICTICANTSNCQSKQVGAVLVKNNRVVSTGVNGTLPGAKNCCDIKFDTRAEHSEWSLVNEIHAEVNCIVSAFKNGIMIDGTETLYCTLEPCAQCIKFIAAVGIKKIYYLKDYDLSTSNRRLEFEFKLHNNISVIKINPDNPNHKFLQ